MLVGAPGSEAGEIIKNLARIRMKNMRAVLMYKNTCRIEVIVSVAADVRAAIAKQYSFVRACCKPFCDDTACKSCANDEVIERVAHAASMLKARRLQSASAIRCSRRATIESHELSAASARPCSIRHISGWAAARAQASAKVASPSAIVMTSLNCAMTSSTGVETIGRPVAIYSKALVGLINRVASFIAKGMMQTSKAFA